jgi:hypothetical protein
MVVLKNTVFVCMLSRLLSVFNLRNRRECGPVS